MKCNNHLIKEKDKIDELELEETYLPAQVNLVLVTTAIMMTIRMLKIMKKKAKNQYAQLILGLIIE